MKKNSKAFTLVELLGVVVIIAVIALITTPVVMSIMKNSRRTAYLRSAESMGRASSLFYSDNTELFTTQQGIMDFLCENNGCSRIYDESGNLLSASSDIGRGTLAIYPNGNIEYLLTNGEFCVTKYADESSAKVIDGDCSKIDIKKDKTPAELDYITHSSTTKSITATIYAHDDETGIYGYSCSIDGEHYSKISSNNTCYFPDLKTGKYTIYFKVYNGTYGKDTYNETISVAIFTKEIATKTIDVPEYTIVPDGTKWAQAKTVNISEPNQEGVTSLYSIDNGDTWSKGSSVVIRKNNTNVIAKFTDGINTVRAASTLLVKNIDETAPTATLKTTATTKSIHVAVTAEDKESGIFGYQYAISSDGVNFELGNVTNDQTHVFDNLKSGTYYVRVVVTNIAYNNTEEEYRDPLIGKVIIDKKVILRECPIPTYIITPNDDKWYQSKTVTIDYGNEEGCIGLFLVDEGNTWKEKNSVTFVNNGNIVAKNTDGVNTVTASTQYINKIDSTPPEFVSLTTTQTTNSITVTASGKDEQSGIKAYKFSKDDGETWTDWQTSNVYTFGGLKTGTYKVKAKVHNGTYGNLGSNEDKGATASPTKSVTLVGCTTPEFGYPNNDKNIWTQSKLINISGSTGFKTKYRINNTGDFVEGNSVNITENGTKLTAIVTDGTNTCSSSTLTVTYIDRTAPTSVTNNSTRTNNSITLTVAATDNESGIAGYSFRINNGTWSDWQTSNVHTFTGLTGNTTYTVQSRAKNGTVGSNESEIITESAPSNVTTLSPCPTPTISLSSSGSSCTTSRIATIDYGSVPGCTGTYSKDGGSTWSSGSTVTFYNNGTLIARNVDSSENVKLSSTQTIPCTDNSTPTTTLTVTSNGSTIPDGGSVSTTTYASLSCSNDGESGIGGYYIEVRDSVYSTLITSETSSSLSFNPASSTSGNIIISGYCTSGAGKQSSTKSQTVVYSGNSSSSCTPYSSCGSCPYGYSGSKYYNSSCDCVDNCTYSPTPSTPSCTVGASCGSCSSGYTGGYYYDSSCNCVNQCKYSGGGSSGGGECTNGQTKTELTLGCDERCKTCLNPYTCKNGKWELGWKYCTEYYPSCSGSNPNGTTCSSGSGTRTGCWCNIEGIWKCTCSKAK